MALAAAPAALEDTAAPTYGAAVLDGTVTPAPPAPAEAQPASEATRADAATSDRRHAIRTGLIDALPVIAGVLPFGLVIGVAVGESTVNNAAGWAGSFLMFGGSAHLAAISLLGGGAGAAAVLVTVLVINARLLVYSASLGPRFRHQPTWFRWTAPYFLVDQMFALTWSRLDTGVSAGWLRAYYLSAAIATGLVWVAAIATGVLVGPVIPASWELSFATPALMLALLMPALINRPAVIAAIVGATVAVLLIGLPHGLHLLIGTGVGTITGIAAERIQR